VPCSRAPAQQAVKTVSSKYVLGIVNQASQVYCTVKEITKDPGGCFTGANTVFHEEKGPIPISEARVGDEVLAVEEDGSLVFTPIVYIHHLRNDIRADFVELGMEDGASLRLTPRHLVPAGDCSECPGPVVATFSESRLTQEAVCVVRAWPTDTIVAQSDVSFLLKEAKDVRVGECVLVLVDNPAETEGASVSGGDRCRCGN
jgi:hypothetical protein